MPLWYQSLTQHDLDIESDITPGVVMEQYPSNVSDAFGEAPTAECDHVRPRLVPDAKEKLKYERETEEGGEEGVSCSIRSVAQDCVFDFAARKADLCALYRGTVCAQDQCVEHDWKRWRNKNPREKRWDIRLEDQIKTQVPPMDDLNWNAC